MHLRGVDNIPGCQAAAARLQCKLNSAWAKICVRRSSPRLRQEIPDGILTDGYVVCDDTGFVNQVGDGGGEHGVATGDFLVLLQYYREGEPVLLHHGADFPGRE